MTKRNTIIKINGKHYNAITGDLLHTPVAAAVTPSKTVVKTVKSIDGVVGGTSVKHNPATAVKSVTKVPAKKPTVSRTAAAHAKAHHVRPSAALMRHAVAKPTSTSLKRHTKVQAPVHSASHFPLASAITVAPKLSLHSVNHQRAKRAAAVATSPSVAHFAREVAVAVSRDVEQAVAAIDKAIVIPQTPTPSSVYRPDVMRPAQVRRQTSDIFEQALIRATSHEEPAPTSVQTAKRRRSLRSLRRRMVSFSAGTVAVLAMIGVFGYHSSGTIKIKMAANRAGFSATIPAYQPKGFSVAKIESSSGFINVRYARDAQVVGASTSFALTEKPSNWNSETLLTNITASSSTSTYTTVKKAGRTVYVYGRNQAAWVNNGILYQVLGNGALSTHEFGEIAASM